MNVTTVYPISFLIHKCNIFTASITRITLGLSVNVAYSRSFYRKYGNITEIFVLNFFTGYILTNKFFANTSVAILYRSNDFSLLISIFLCKKNLMITIWRLKIDIILFRSCYPVKILIRHISVILHIICKRLREYDTFTERPKAIRVNSSDSSLLYMMKKKHGIRNTD
jgi:hypothetical protein